MKTTFVAVMALAAASTAVAQLSDLPSCAQSCAFSAFSASGCSETDVACDCKNTAFLDTIAKCVAKSCSASDAESTYNFAEKLCSSAGVTIDLGSATAAGAAAATTTAAAASGANDAVASASSTMSTTASSSSAASTGSSSTSGTATSSATAAMQTTNGAGCVRVGGWLSAAALAGLAVLGL